MDTDLEGKRGFLRLNARPWPELSVEGDLCHNLPALGGLPERSRLRAACRAAAQQYDAEGLIQVDECAVGASGAVMSQSGLQGSVVYHNNCTLIQVPVPLSEYCVIMQLAYQMNTTSLSNNLLYHCPFLFLGMG